jgi:hypothetical protein
LKLLVTGVTTAGSVFIVTERKTLLLAIEQFNNNDTTMTAGNET